MSLVATLEDRIAGHVLLSAARLDAPRRIVAVLTLPPLGVLPEFQGQGIGARLIAHAPRGGRRPGCAAGLPGGAPLPRHARLRGRRP
ncbi:GNAT family N-acetyltransferase [Streptomyces bottropensis]|uniref:GNAT family N-acetyltransferase n=1 Tax=Streptomyces bottropensis TaxID=42235 RepID=UPI003686F019